MTGTAFSLEGKAVLITGAARGIGAAIANACASQGARLFLQDLNESSVSAVAHALRASGHEVQATGFDLTNMEACVRWVQNCAKEAGHIWGLVNNAGITKHGHVLDQTVEDYRSIYDLHVFAPFVLSKEAAKVMQRATGRQRGRIVSMSSIAGTHPRPGIGNYASSKAAIAGLTRSLAADFGRNGICANAIAPGYVLTEMNQRLLSDADFIKRIEGRTPAARWAEPHEIANVAVFLLSEASSYVNGQIIAVDGGMNSFLMGEAS